MSLEGLHQTSHNSLQYRCDVVEHMHVKQPDVILFLLTVQHHFLFLLWAKMGHFKGTVCVLGHTDPRLLTPVLEYL